MAKPWILIAILILIPAVGQAAPTTIKGGRMEVLNQGEKVVFSGNVTLVRGQDTLKAEEMITNNQRDKITVKGKVRLIRKIGEKEEWRGYGDSGFYDTTTGSGYLKRGKDQAHLIYTDVISSTVTRRMDAFADEFDFYEKDNLAVGHKNVYGKTINPDNGELYEMWSDQADYNGNQRKIVLSGTPQPLLKQTLAKIIRTMKADVITYFIPDRRIIGEGNVEVVSTGDEYKKGAL